MCGFNEYGKNLLLNCRLQIVKQENTSSDDSTTPSPSSSEDNKMKFYTLLDDITKTPTDSDLQIELRNNVLNLSDFRELSMSNSDRKKHVIELVEKFESYVNSVPKYCRPNIHKETLFYGFLIVERITNIIQTKFKFPQAVSTCLFNF